MKRFVKMMGSVLLSMAALITIVGPASINAVAVEEMPESMKNKR